MRGKLLFSLSIINWYANTLTKIYFKFYKTFVNGCFSFNSSNFIKFPGMAAFLSEMFFKLIHQIVYRIS